MRVIQPFFKFWILLGIALLICISVNKIQSDISVKETVQLKSTSSAMHDKDIISIESTTEYYLDKSEKSYLGNTSVRMTDVSLSTETLSREYVLRQDLETFDPLTLKTPLPFLKEYKNPCFKDEHSKLYCLPYFFILASQKSGTSDLYRKVVLHPQISSNKKEFHWWNRARFVPYPKHPRINFSQYMDWYNSSTKQMNDVVIDKEYGPYHPLVFGDGTASSLYDQLEWRKIPQNFGLTKPAVISADVIKHVLPKAKFLVILRNPTERLYSDYTYYNERRSDSNKFHEKVAKGISWFQDCLAHKVQKQGSCLYDFPEYVNVSKPGWHPDTSWDPVIRLRAGLYSEFLIDWFNVFPRDQFHVFTLEEFSRDTVTKLQHIYKFLDLDPPPESILQGHFKHRSRATKTNFKMPFLNKTRELINTFYRPYNVKLSKLLESGGTIWG